MQIQFLDDLVQVQPLLIPFFAWQTRPALFNLWGIVWSFVQSSVSHVSPRCAQTVNSSYLFSYLASDFTSLQAFLDNSDPMQQHFWSVVIKSSSLFLNFLTHSNLLLYPNMYVDPSWNLSHRDENLLSWNLCCKWKDRCSFIRFVSAFFCFFLNPFCMDF